MRYKLETIGLGKRYGESVALAPTDLQVRAGEFLTLLGPSGSGKTTLLQMISGLTLPSSGTLLLDGVDATQMPPGKRGIGMVFQNYALFPHMTVWENVAYGLRMRRAPVDELKRAVAAALAMVKMDEYAHRYPRELSGGQQQRIALARCFVYRPSVILLDEPLGALDKKLREHMQLEIRHLHAELQATFIYVTHDQDEALAMSDRICLMNQARIEQIGTPSDLYDRPATCFAAGFIGHSNLLDGHVETAEGGARRFHAAGRSLALEGAAQPPGVMRDGKAWLLVRPEAAELRPQGQGLLDGSVAEVVFLGAEVRAIVAVDADRRVSVRCGSSVAPRVGEAVGVHWDMARATLLQQ
ncbi:ABC transporter ATP-binding protein [Achromobacter xylosoxidans]